MLHLGLQRTDRKPERVTNKIVFVHMLRKQKVKTNSVHASVCVRVCKTVCECACVSQTEKITPSVRRVVA